MTETKENLLIAISFLRSAIKAAKAEAGEGATVNLAVTYTRPDGTGRVAISMQAEEFVEDVAKLLNAPEYTVNDELEYNALKIVQQIKGK